MGFLDMFRTPPEPAAPPAIPARPGQLTPVPLAPDALAHLVGGGMLGNVQVIGDTTHITQEQRDKLKAFGIDLDAIVAAGGAGAGSAAAFTTVAGAFGSDDAVSQLERLAALRDRGVLTDDEFAAQKKKILDA